ncbi:hypothetical protein [Paenibacillus terrigena]|uniref:hypothetical protein n=1 Tax=Paenibacillus terrigena TaxID=369333 RepID=UPI0028D4FD86|nr:hypothetical protein [Paenibacillus terrigena]
MTHENYSMTRFTISKKENQENMSIQINNSGNEVRNITLKVEDPENQVKLPAYVDGKEIDTQVSIPAESKKTLVINVQKANKKVALEISHNAAGGGMSIRQRSSSNSGGKPQDTIELMIK